MNTFLYKKENKLIDNDQITKLLNRFNEIFQKPTCCMFNAAWD